MLSHDSEVGQELGKIEAGRHNARVIAVPHIPGQPGARGRLEGNGAVLSRLTGALMRALLIAVLVLAPSLLVPGIPADAQQTVGLVAVFAAVLICVEYLSEAPGLIEFRDAPPFNRIRFLILAGTVLLLSTVERGRTDPSTLTQLVEALGLLLGQALDFPYSPVHLATQALAPGATDAHLAAIRGAAGIAFLTMVTGLAAFCIVIRNWPMAGRSFNVWVNLPTFDPTSGADIVQRLERDARLNLALGFLLPFLAPALVRFALGGFDPQTVAAPLTMIWVMAAWSFVPASLFMRGIAMQRIARMISAKRRASAELRAAEGYAAA